VADREPPLCGTKISPAGRRIASTCLPACLCICLALQHNVRLQLTYLDVAQDGEVTSKAAKKTEALMKHAMQPPKTYGSQHSTQSTNPSSSTGTSSAS